MSTAIYPQGCKDIHLLDNKFRSLRLLELPTMSTRRKPSKSIVANNVYRRTTVGTHCCQQRLLENGVPKPLLSKYLSEQVPGTYIAASGVYRVTAAKSMRLTTRSDGHKRLADCLLKDIASNNRYFFLSIGGYGQRQWTSPNTYQ